MVPRPRWPGQRRRDLRPDGTGSCSPVASLHPPADLHRGGVHQVALPALLGVPAKGPSGLLRRIGPPLPRPQANGLAHLDRPPFLEEGFQAEAPVAPTEIDMGGIQAGGSLPPPGRRGGRCPGSGGRGRPRSRRRRRPRRPPEAPRPDARTRRSRGPGCTACGSNGAAPRGDLGSRSLIEDRDGLPLSSAAGGPPRPAPPSRPGRR
jgi:hypothetical protein